MRISLEPSFILHQRPYREASLIIDFLTQNYGLISLVAKGARNLRRNRVSLQPFSPLLISWQGKTELMTLTAVEEHGLPFRLKGQSLLSGFYLNEILKRVLHKEDPFPQLYVLYSETLLELQEKGLHPRILRLFEKKLLAALGYGLQLQQDIENNPLDAEKYYQFSHHQGFKLCEREAILPSEFLFLGKSLLALLTENLHEEDCLKDAKRLMRLAFLPLLGSKPLHSRKLFVEVK